MKLQEKNTEDMTSVSSMVATAMIGMKHIVEDRQSGGGELKQRHENNKSKKDRKKIQKLCLYFKRPGGFVEIAVVCVIYVSTALGTGLSHVHRVSRTAAIWQTAKFSDESINRELIIIVVCSVWQNNAEILWILYIYDIICSETQ